MKYARFFLTKDDEPQELSATAITVTSGQKPTDPTCGVYLYTGSAFTSETDLRVTVNIPSSAASTIEDYRVVAYFSDEDPQTYSGTTITKEPATLDVKKIYKFSYPIIKKDKYIAWGTNSASLNIASSITSDFPALTSSSTKGYIGWTIYTGPYSPSASKAQVKPHRNAIDVWSLTGNGKSPLSPYNGGEGIMGTLSISDAQISGSWSDFTNPTLYAPGTQIFEEFKNYVVVAGSFRCVF